mgnify:CR=1 FL=1
MLEKADMMKALESFPQLVEMLFKDTMEDRMQTNEQREANYQPSWTARQPVDPRAVSVYENMCRYHGSMEGGCGARLHRSRPV